MLHSRIITSSSVSPRTDRLQPCRHRFILACRYRAVCYRTKWLPPLDIVEALLVQHLHDRIVSNFARLIVVTATDSTLVNMLGPAIMISIAMGCTAVNFLSCAAVNFFAVASLIVGPETAGDRLFLISCVRRSVQTRVNMPFGTKLTMHQPDGSIVTNKLTMIEEELDSTKAHLLHLATGHCIDLAFMTAK